MSKQRKELQYNEAGELVYQVGNNGPAGDVSGVKEPANKAEAQCFKLLQDNGWTPTKRGWPDFFCIKGNRVCAVEVKPRSTTPLKKNQLVIMGELSAKGIPCFLWSPDGGFEEVKGVIRNCLIE